MAAALTNHPHIRKISLISTHPGLSSETERSKRETKDQKWVSLLEQEGIQKFVEQWETIPLWHSQKTLPDELLSEQKNIRLGHNPLQLAHSLKTVGLAKMPDYGQRLSELNIPVDLIVGEKDLKFVDLAKSMDAHLNTSTMFKIENCGHNPLLEKPDALGKILHKEVL